MELRSIYHDALLKAAVYPQIINNTHVHDAGVDTAGYEGVAFIIATGAIAGGSTVSFKAQSCATDTDGSYADITGATATYLDSEDNKVTVIDVHRPILRYVRLVATNGAAFDAYVSAVAVLYGGRSQPVTQVGPATAGTYVTDI